MRAVFLSYRRDDTQTVTGFIYQHLTAPVNFGPDGVFVDIDGIPPGIDFREVIDESVGQCRFFLAVIGPRWVNARLQHPGDFVRLEIEAALRRGIPVVPLLVDGATMPKPEELPDSLHPLLFKNAHSLRPGRHFSADIEQLVKGLHRAEEWKQRKAGAETPPLPVRAPLSPPSPTREGAGGSGTNPAGGVATVPSRKAGDKVFLDLPGGVKMAFAWCPPGTFRMGSPASEEGRSDGELQHEVRLTRGFYSGIHPVTQAEWRVVLGTTPSHFEGANCPVERVSWDDAVAFCEKVRELTDASVRLPTEAEWEYACRGGTTTPFYWGHELNGTQANCCGDYPYGTHTKGSYLEKTSPVGSYAQYFPHPWGLTDVHGSVYEWCADWRDDTFYARSPKDDPECRGGGKKYRILRGGSWDNEPRHCRAASRSWMVPGARRSSYGFRVVFNVD